MFSSTKNLGTGALITSAAVILFATLLHGGAAKVVRQQTSKLTRKALRSKRSSAVDMSLFNEVFSTDSERALSDIKHQVLPLIRKLVPGWTDVEDFRISQISNAMTNHVFRVQKSSEPNQNVLLRIYGSGTDVLFSRELEKASTRSLSDAQFGPGVWGEFDNGRLESWILSTTIDHKQMMAPELSPKIARKLRVLHSLEPPAMLSSRVPSIWKKLDDWYDVLSMNVVVHGSTRLQSATCSYEEGGAGMDLRALGDEILRLKRCLGDNEHVVTAEDDGVDEFIGGGQVLTPVAIGKEVVMCHNDLQQGNILVAAPSGEVEFIDFEYSGVNYVAYDIANHFCEGCFDYGLPPREGADWSLYPTAAVQQRFIAAYLGVEETHAHVAALQTEVNRFALASHLLWGIWSLLNALSSNVDFDYAGYGAVRLRRYVETREELLGE